MDNSIQQLYRQTIQALNNADVEDSSIVAIFIIEHVFSQKYVVLLSKSISVDKKRHREVLSVVDQFISGIPLAYIFNQATFRNNQYYVSEGVLIPRPETEEMVEYLIKIIQQLLSYQVSLSVIELGLGSGVISLELAQVFPDLFFSGWDISEAAILATTRNKENFNIENLAIHFGDFFNFCDDYPSNELVLMVSNPPYVSESEYKSLDRYVLKEPKEALVAGDDGLEIIIRSIQLSIERSMIYVAEIGFAQSGDIQQRFPTVNMVFLTDFSGRDRFIVYIPESYSWAADFRCFLLQLNK